MGLRCCHRINPRSVLIADFRSCRTQRAACTYLGGSCTYTSTTASSSPRWFLATIRPCRYASCGCLAIPHICEDSSRCCHGNIRTVPCQSIPLYWGQSLVVEQCKGVKIRTMGVVHNGHSRHTQRFEISTTMFTEHRGQPYIETLRLLKVCLRKAIHQCGLRRHLLTCTVANFAYIDVHIPGYVFWCYLII